MRATRVLPAIVLFALVTVEFGGWSLLGFLVSEEALTPVEEQFFRAGHAHAGVLLILSLVFFILLGRTDFSERTSWILGLGLLAGILLQSGWLLHPLRRRRGRCRLAGDNGHPAGRSGSCRGAGHPGCRLASGAPRR